MNNTTDLDISICIITFRRPDKLNRLLMNLQDLSVTENFTFDIIVVDNDVSESARGVVESYSGKIKNLSYYVEPKQNIALARNRAVGEARGKWIAFIDDDEMANKNWLDEYWKIQKKIPSDGYLGPVLPVLEQKGPPWLKEDIILHRKRYKTGTQIPYGDMRTGNAFVKRELFEKYKFDQKYGLTGGADIELFIRMADNSVRFLWCDTAITYEYYPPWRMNLNWLVQRSFRGGITHTRIQKYRQPHFFHHLVSLTKALGGIFAFSIILPWEFLRGRTFAVMRIMRICVQIGHIWAYLNLKYEEYKIKAPAKVSQ